MENRGGGVAAFGDCNTGIRGSTLEEGEGTAYAVVILTVGLILFQVIPGPMLRMFNASDTMMSLGITSAIGNAHHTRSTFPSIASPNATGSSTSRSAIAYSLPLSSRTWYPG